MQVYDSDDGGWVVVGGTSEASPLIAGLLRGGRVGRPGPVVGVRERLAAQRSLERLERHLCSATISYICNAGPGYDGPTGVGSISGAVAAGAPGIAGPEPTGPTRRP